MTLTCGLCSGGEIRNLTGMLSSRIIKSGIVRLNLDVKRKITVSVIEKHQN